MVHPASPRRNRRLLLSLSTALGLALPAVAVAAPGLPSGGTVAAGSAAIAGSAQGVTITQTSANAVIKWQSFSVGQGQTVSFVQPTAQSATLNRVTGSAASTIAGQITADGTVYLINPNGIAITKTGAVQTGGGFVASTLDMADADFMAGKAAFAGKGASAATSNAGSIAAGKGAYVALLGGTVANSGTITVPYGRVALGSGEQVALDLNGGNFLRVAMPSAQLGGHGALVDNSGTIVVNGGSVTLSAAVVKAAVRNVINISGTINADSATGDGGSIIVLGGADTADMAGTVTVSGTLSARATGAAGHGGTIETSGASVDFGGATILTGAAHGAAGTWLIDPTDLVIGTSADQTALQNALATGNVTLATSASGAPTEAGVSGIGETASGNGDITIAVPLAWASANTLTLQAANAINLNAAIAAPTGGLTLSAGAGITASGGIKIGTFTLSAGNWVQNAASLPVFSAAQFDLAVTTASFLRVTGGSGTTAAPYQIADVYGLQGAASNSLLGQSFALTANIDATGTAAWNSGEGFLPIGSAVFGGAATPYYSTFNGAGFTINGLTVNQPSGHYMAMFGYLSGKVENLTLTNASITGAGQVGGIAGFQSGGLISNVSFGGTVTGAMSGYGDNSVGGLVGFDQSGTITGSSASGTVTGADTQTDIGGLAGYINNATISKSFATNSVSGSNISNVGGLVGFLDSTGMLSQVYATGAVSGGSGNAVGGLVSEASSGARIIYAYAAGAVSGTNQVGGLIGSQSAGYLTNAYATGSVTGVNNVGGLIGYSGGATIAQTYATGLVTAQLTYGGLIGNLYGSKITNSVWNAESTGQTAGYSLPGGLSGGTFSATGLTTAQMQDLGSAATNYPGFDFTNVWSPPTQAGQGGQSAAYYPQLYAVTPVVVGTLADVSRPYGSANPTFGTTTGGGTGTYALGPTGDSLGTVNFGSTTATASSNAGMYTITPAGGTATSLDGVTYRKITLGSGTLTIDPVMLTAVTANLTGSTGKTYDGTNTATLTSANYQLTGFVGTDGAVVTQTVGTYATANAGTGILVTAQLTSADFTPTGTTNLANYTLPTSASGAIGTITPLALTGSIATGTSIYGQSLAPGAVTFTNLPTGISAPAATVTVQTAGHLSSSGNLAVGSYSGIETISSLSGNSTGDFTFAGISGGYTVTPASLSATIAPGSSVYGAALAPGAVSLSGLVHGDQVSTAGVAVATAGHLSSSGNLAAGTYGSAETLASATLGGADAGNYVLANPGIAGSYTVTPLALTGTLASGTSTYGAALAPGAATLTNVMSGDNVVLGPVTLTTGGNLSASGHLNAGTYAGIEQVSSISGTDIGNYTFAGLTGSYTVTPATLMVTYTATAASTTYGVAPGALTGTYTATGLVDGDNLGGSAAFTSSVSATTHVGTYAITGSGITADSNYTLTSVQAAGNATALAVTPASLTITYTATPLTRNAGTTPTGLTGTSNAVGLVNGDTLSGTAAFTTPATAASPAGSYAINGSGLTASSDYTLTAVQAPGNATALTLLKPPATAQSLATYVQDVIPVYHPFMTLRPCEPLKVSRVYRTDGQVVLTRVQGGGDCPLPAMP